jgi:hypothetical protein
MDEPPSGEGRLVLADVVDTKPPPFDQRYAFAMAEGSQKAIGLNEGRYGSMWANLSVGCSTYDLP